MLKRILFFVALVFSSQLIAGPKVLFVLTSHDTLGDTGEQTGYWLGELTHPYKVLHDAGFEISIASIKGGKAPIDARSTQEEDAVNTWFLQEAKRQAAINNTLALQDISASDYQAVIYSGGHGTMFDFRGNPDVARVTRGIYENNGIVAAVCHGPAALLDITLSNGKPLLAGKKVTGFSNLEEDMVKLTQHMPYLLEDAMAAQAATFTKATPWQSHVEVSQRVVTGQNPQSAEALGHAVKRLLK